MQTLRELVDANSDIEFTINGSVQLTPESLSRIREDNIARGREYLRKLEAGIIKPYSHVDARSCSGVRPAKKLKAQRPRHVPLRDHVQARRDRQN